MSKLYAGFGKYKGQKVLFHADDLYDENGNKKSIGATDVEITAPSTATNGTLSSDDLAILQASKLNGIMFDGERYVAMDIGHDSGFLVYTHVGRDNSVNYYLKCIGITISTLGWVKTSMELQNLEANVQEQAAAFLETLKVGNAVYSIPPTVVAEDNLPTATATSPNFVNVKGTLYWKRVYETPTILGFTGLTNSSGNLTYTDNIASVGSYTTSTSGDYVTVSSPLDDYFPYNQLTEVTDSDGNVFIRFPKMYIKWVKDSNGYVDGIKVSDQQIDGDYFVPDCFLDYNSDTTYKDYCYIGKYEGSGSSSRVYSKSGQTCLVSVKRAQCRTGCHANGSQYHQYDISMFTLYNFLTMMYYKTSDIQRVYAGRTSASSANNTGSVDGVTKLNGWNTSTSCVKMLGVENPYGNIYKWVDGIYFSSSTIYVHKFAAQYADSSSGASTIGFSRPTSGNRVQYLKTGTSNATRSNIYCSNATSSTGVYFDDYYGYNSSGTVLYVGGPWSNASHAGLFSLYGSNAASFSYSSIGCRLCARAL